MMYPLLTVILETQGVSGTLIGISTMVQAVGSLIVTPFLPAIMRRTGLAALMATSAVAEMILFLMLYLTQDVWAWMPLRILLGVCGSIAFYGSEYWIIALAPPARRGNVVGVYAFMVAATLGIGPLMLTVIGYEGLLPFALPMMLCVAGAIPALLARRHAPRFSGEGSLQEVPRFILGNPTICFAVVLFGALEAGVLSLLPAWGVRAGIGADAAVTLIGIAGFGTVFIQPLMGPAADRWNRRTLLALCAAVCAALMVAIPFLYGLRLTLWIMVFLWGGISAGLYTVALVELGARYDGRMLAVGNAALVMGYSFGALVGPPLAGGMMDAVPPHGMLYSLAVGCVIYLVLLLRRGAAPR